MKTKVLKAMMRLGISKKTVYTAKELDAIANEAMVDMFTVMWVLRYEI